MSHKQVQDTKGQYEDKKCKMMVIAMLILLGMLFLYCIVFLLTKPGMFNFLVRDNYQKAPSMSDNRKLQVHTYNYKATKRAIRNQEIEICRHLNDTLGILSNEHRQSVTQQQNNESAEFFNCIATMVERSLSENQPEFVSDNSDVVDLRFGSGRQMRTNVIRALFEAARETDQAITSGRLPVIAMRMNSQAQEYFNRLIMLMELDTCQKPIVRVCTIICKFANGAC